MAEKKFVLKDPTDIPSEIVYRCRQCLQDINFALTSPSGPFPVMLENVHGSPAHRLIISVNKHYQVESFELKPLEAEKREASSMSKETLMSIGLDENEIAVYFGCSGKGPISVNEIALRAEVSKESALALAAKFVQRGLFKQLAGETYEALPPYAAIISQLDKFGVFISDIKTSTPQKLSASFKAFEEKAAGVEKMKDFLVYLDKNVAGLIQFRDQSVGLVENAYKNLEQQFGGLHTRIAENLDKLHLGIIMQTVDSVIKKTVDNELEAIKQGQGQFIKNMIALANNAGSIGTALKRDFENIMGLLNKSFDELRTTFANNVVITLDDVLGQILNKLNISNTTVKEFWEQAKLGAAVQMKDVWFIRSAEGMRGHINDMVSRAKMRLLIVAPTLLDIDVKPLFEIPKFINIRICTYIDAQNPAHLKVLDEFDRHQNIAYRHRELQNLWGINKDYEEIITGIASREDIEGVKTLQVVAIGSGIQEHIKIFVPVLEEGWMNAKKEIPQLGMRVRVEPETPVDPAYAATGFSAANKLAPKASSTPAAPMPTSAMGMKSQDIPKPIPQKDVSSDHPISSPGLNSNQQNFIAQHPTPQTPIAVPTAGFSALSESELKEAGIQLNEVKPPPGSTKSNYHKVLTVLDEMIEKPPSDFYAAFNDLNELIKKELKFSLVLKDLKMWMDDLRRSASVDEKKRSMLLKKMADWAIKIEEEGKK